MSNEKNLISAMKKHLLSTFIVFVAFLLFVQNPCFSQGKKIELRSITTDASMYPQRIRISSWIPGTRDLAYSKDMKELQKTSYPSGKTETIVTAEELRSLLSPFFADADRSKSMLSRIPQHKWVNKTTFLFEHANTYFSYDVTRKQIEKINSWPVDGESHDFCFENNIMAYTKGNNLYISVQGKEVAVTNETDPSVRMCNYVHREEFGITKGTFWSPKGNFLAFYRMDESDVTDYPLVDVTQRIAELQPEKYPMAGMNSHYVTLGVYEISSGKTVYMNTGLPKEQYLTSVSWSPDEKYIFTGILNRAQNHLKLNMYEAGSGKFIRTLFEEKSDKYVEPLHPLHFIPGQNDKFLWMSQRDGFMHLYMYNTDGTLIRQLTKGKWIVSDLIGFDEKGTQVFIHANPENPLDQHIFRVNLKNGKMLKVSSQSGYHNGSFSDDGAFCLDMFSSMDVASQALVLDASGKTAGVILEKSNPLALHDMPATEIFSLEASDGTELFCRLIKPHDFDASKKYPVIIYVYGGPHAQLITNSWLGGAGLFLNYLAQEGYIVFTLDNRGSANRGFEFESALHLNMGSVEVEDQMTGVTYLTSLPYVDADRIGLHGWSYGGFMTISMMLQHPGIFKAGVAGGPVTDWKYYEVMYGERYMGTPENNPLGYEQASLLNKAANLEGRLLIIHGAVDPVVVWQHSLMFLEECIRAGKHVDYFVYPTEEHNVGWGNRNHLHEKIVRYFEDFLK